MVQRTKALLAPLLHLQALRLLLQQPRRMGDKILVGPRYQKLVNIGKYIQYIQCI